MCAYACIYNNNNSPRVCAWCILCEIVVFPTRGMWLINPPTSERCRYSVCRMEYQMNRHCGRRAVITTVKHERRSIRLIQRVNMASIPMAWNRFGYGTLCVISEVVNRQITEACVYIVERYVDEQSTSMGFYF